MGHLIVVKHVNIYIRKDLNMSVSDKIYNKLNERVQEVLENAAARAELDNRTTILEKDL